MRHIVDSKELLHDLSAESIPSASRGERELVAVWVWIRPDKVSHWTFVGDFAEAVDDFDLVDRMNGG